MNMRKCASVVEQREQIIASACAALAKDLRKVDPSTYVLFFQTTNMPDVFEWINDTVDRHFPSGAMAFACTGDCMTAWDEPPVSAIDVEFEVPEVSAFFRLYFAAKGAAVELHHIAFDDPSDDPSSNTQRLAHCLEVARMEC